MGYSFDGLNALILSGAKINPDFYLNYCKEADELDPPLEDWYYDLECKLSENWDEFVNYASENLSVDSEGLWSPLSDKVFKAAMPMAADGAWLFGEKGLADVEIPVLLIQTKYDTSYQIIEAKFIFEHLGTTEKQMITFLEKGHSMIYDPESISKMAHFAVAFFGYHLQDHEEYAQYFSKEFVDQYEDLFFGFYEE
jgi:predicted dienelactone hydrolase